MIIKKNFGLKNILFFTGKHFVWLISWTSLVTATYFFTNWQWIRIPWLPISVIGTAVAFYVGFKNNSAYDRLWEARKIWGGIVNNSRSLGSNVKAYISNQFKEDEASESELFNLRKKIIYRHISWLYTLRAQLLIPTEWEHISQGGHLAKQTKKRNESIGEGASQKGVIREELSPFISENELNKVMSFKNKATQLIDIQSQELVQLRKSDLIDDFRHMELQKILNEFYNLQGKAERIKKFPLPRQYASISFMFVGIFIFLIPFGMISLFSEMKDLGEYGVWFSIPFSILLSWVFLVMELVGDYSENPFEGLGNDIPMLSLTRTIEIDLREMLGETDLPPAIEAKNNILM